jgi:hypothetical protein
MMAKADEEESGPEKPTDRFTMLCKTFGSIAGMSGAASFMITWVALANLHNITDAGMFAIALMAAAPAGLGVGVSLCLYLAFAADTRSPRSAGQDAGSEQFVRRLP